MDRQAARETTARSGNGFIYVALGIALIAFGVFVVLGRPSPMMVGVFGVCLIGGVLCLSGLYMLQPNQGALMTLFGSYRGTDLAEGLRWANPFLVKKKVSLRARNFNSEKLKVNDLRVDAAQLTGREPLDLGPELRVDAQQERLLVETGHRARSSCLRP